MMCLVTTLRMVKENCEQIALRKAYGRHKTEMAVYSTCNTTMYLANIIPTRKNLINMITFQTRQLHTTLIICSYHILIPPCCLAHVIHACGSSVEGVNI